MQNENDNKPFFEKIGHDIVIFAYKIEDILFPAKKQYSIVFRRQTEEFCLQETETAKCMKLTEK